MSPLGILTAVITVSTIVVGIVIVLENRNPSRTMTWLLILIFVPIFGIFLYLYLGQNHRKKRTFIKKRKQDYRIIRRLLDNQIFESDHGDLFTRRYNDVRGKVLPLMINNGDAPLTANNRSRLLKSGETAFETMLEAIESASHHVHMEYFIIKESVIGRRFQQALIKKAREGVSVRLIYDAVGSWRLSRRFLDEMREAGVEVKPFLKVFYPVILAHRLNYRNHRKLLVVDGRMGFTGGFNIGDEYLGKSPELGYWRDTQVQIEGEAVYALQVIFLRDWYFVSGQEMDDKIYFPRREHLGNQLIQVVSSGPDSLWASIHQGYFMAITTAMQRVYICTPYLVPDESILVALKTAALRGVDVRILLPGSPDHRTVFWASKSHFQELLEAGVRIFQYQKGFMHSKVVLVDDNFTSVGTTNMDIRSFDLNFEVNAFYYDEAITRQMSRDFFEDLTDSIEVSLEHHRQRPLIHRFKESAMRLLSPIL
ncbi:cardiolipin synthase [Anoxynatronum sibiricum]|uniref:Cardiolipin synthase n=1 Tax=Anoxynatronum sibiricum TaxID=210623 RepID=A0ABU9VWW5_9CLOT